MNEKLEQLSNVCKRVINIIEQNEPGLATWHIALARTCQELKAILEDKEAENPPRGEKRD